MSEASASPSLRQLDSIFLLHLLHKHLSTPADERMSAFYLSVALGLLGLLLRLLGL